MNFLKVSALAVLALFLSVPAFAQAGPSSVVAIYNGSADPCGAAWIAKSSAVVAITSDTTTQLVPLQAGKTVYACGFIATFAGTTPAIVFKTGTGSACATGTASLTGALTYATGAQIVWSGGFTKFSGASGGALCVTTSGTTSNLQGVLTYVSR